MKCSNPETYRVTREWKEAGLESAEQVRHEMLWRFVRGELDSGATAVRGHLTECAECRELADSFRRLDVALHSKQARVFAVCPSPSTLAAYVDNELPAEERAKIDAHLKQCEPCRKDLAWLQKPASAEVVEISRRGWFKWAGAAAAMLITGSFTWWKLRPSSPYAHLAEVPAIDRQDLLRTAGSDETAKSLFEEAVDAYERNDYRTAADKAQQILRVNGRNSSALFVMGMSEYRMGRLPEAARLITESESIRPKTDYRCWTALQFALLTGDVVRIRKECQHVDGDPRYQARARRILAEVQRLQQS